MIAGCKVLGSVTGEGNPLNGIGIKLTGDRQDETTTENDGNYRFTVIHGTYTVTPVPKPGDVFFPSAKQVFVRPWKEAAVNFSKLSDNEPYWEPDIVVPIQAYPEVRGLKVMRGIIHLHSIYSHDACDKEPFIDGKPNEQCLYQLREAICYTNQQFVMMSDHPDSFAYHEFPYVLLYDRQRGDELIRRDGMPVANIINCGNGNRTIITAGAEGGLMPLGLKRMPDGTPAERERLLGDSSIQTVDKLHELGAMVFVTHAERWVTSDLINLPIDGIDVYNFHRNADPRDLLHPDEDPGGLSWCNVLLTFKMVGLSWENRPSADLVLLGFLEKNERDLEHLDRLLCERRTVGILATDAHRNALRFNLPDGDRADSYRRVMKLFSNYVLVKDQNLEEIETAVRRGRMYGAFQVFGEPVGFDYYAQTLSQTFEMGDEVPLSAGPVLHVKLPQFYRMNPNLEKPKMIARIIKAGKNGGNQVKWSHNQDLVFEVREPGAYRAEIQIYPYHLGNWLGDKPNDFMSEDGYPFIYANAIFVK
jgi:hypothetical protein